MRSFLTGSGLRILSLEDDYGLANVTKDALDAYGIVMDIARSVKDVVNMLKNKYFQYDICWFDLELQDNQSGIDAIRKIKMLNKYIPKYIMSAHIYEDVWSRKLKPLNDVLKVNKPIPNPERDHEFYNNMVNSGKKYRKIAYKYEKIFNMGHEEFFDMKKREYKIANDLSYEINKEFLSDYFHNSENDWLIIGDRPGNIVESGFIHEEPSDEDLILISRDRDSSIFFYSRDYIPEESYSGTTKWRQRNEDYYPALLLEFYNGKREIIEFDTGSLLSFMNYEYIEKHKLWDQQPRVVRLVADQRKTKYKYYKTRVMCTSETEDEKILLGVNCRAIINWDKESNNPCKYFYKDREIGLLGRNMLHENEIKVILDGISKTTTVKKSKRNI